jgi:hypothetical protein
MTPTFSTIVNFSLKGILVKIHKLQFISSSESDESIAFPRLKKRLLQTKDETEKTFDVPSEEAIKKPFWKAKMTRLHWQENVA